MIICPNCREEIEEKSHFCDQCGQALQYCTSCGRVGVGRRCTYCGGLMADVDEQENQPSNTSSTAADISKAIATARDAYNNTPQDVQIQGIPTLTLYNPSLEDRKSVV